MCVSLAGGAVRPDPRDRRVRTAPATPTVRQGARPSNSLPFAAPRSLSQQLLFAIAPKLDRLTFRPVPSPDRQPHLPPHLIAAERALKELAPGGPAAAGLLSDGIWQAPGADPVAKPSLDGTRAGAEAPPDDGSCDASSGEVGSCDAPSGENATPSPEMTRADEKQTNLKKYEEYFLRYQLTDRMVKSAAKPDENFRDRKFVWDGADHPTSTGISERRPATDADADETQSVESYQAEIDSDGGGSSSDQVAKSDGRSAEAVDTYAAAEASMLAEVDGSSSDGSTSIVPSSPIEEEINGADDAAKEMMTQLRIGTKCRWRTVMRGLCAKLR